MAPPPRRGPLRRSPLRERKKLQTRATIIERAMGLFTTQGFSRTSIDAIADAADVSRGTFFNYFGHKEGVVVEFGRDLMVALTARVEEQIAANITAERIIHRLWLAVDALREEHGEAIVVLAQELLSPDAERAIWAAEAFPLAALVAKVAAGRRARGLRADLDPALFGALVADAIVAGVATRHRTNDREAADGYRRQSLDVIFRGAMPAGRGPG